MQKEKLLNAVSRYDIGPKNDKHPNSTKWSLVDSVLTIHHLSQDSSCRMVVSVSDVELPDGQFGIYDPAKFSKILSALNSNVTLQYHDGHGKGRAMYISDDQITIDYILSPLDVIFTDQSPDPEFSRPLKGIPSPNVEFELTREFCDKFIKAKNALPDASIIGVSAGKLGNQQDVEFIINYSTHTTTQIKMHITNVTVNSDLELVAFDADYLRDIMMANKDFTTGKMVIYSKVIEDPERGTRVAAGMDLDFTGDGFTSKYRIAKMEIV